MPIILNGTGTISGLTAGGLPNSVITRPNMGYAGAILQVVSATYSIYTSISSTSYTDTGLSASITPSSSSNKVLVLVQQPMGCIGAAAVGYGNQTNGGLQLVRGSTALFTPASDSGGKYTMMLVASSTATGSYLAIYNVVSFSYLDSPATTSSVTYKTQAAKGTSGMGSVDVNSPGGTSSIVLMEVAA